MYEKRSEIRNNEDGMPEEAIKSLFGAFEKHTDCEFIVRIDENLVLQHYSNDHKKTQLDTETEDIEELAENTQEDALAKNKKMLPKNVHIVDYKDKIPQKDLMGLNNVKGIIHHCGQNSLTESFYAGIPIICVPFFGDQRYNASVVEYMALDRLLETKKTSEHYEELSYIDKAKK
uniref:glucuronosyltransferase n=1 Tax=Ditylenchus dipsaci TaxID=166011 RepID=A0A915E283_9BILA